MLYKIIYCTGFISSLRPKRHIYGKKKLFEIIIDGERFHKNDLVAWIGRGVTKSVLKNSLNNTWVPIIRNDKLRKEVIADIMHDVDHNPNSRIIIQEVKE